MLQQEKEGSEKKRARQFIIKRGENCLVNHDAIYFLNRNKILTMLIKSGSEDKRTSFGYLFKSFIHVILARMIISRIQMPFGSFVSFALSLLLLRQEPFDR